MTLYRVFRGRRYFGELIAQSGVPASDESFRESESVRIARSWGS